MPWMIYFFSSFLLLSEVTPSHEFHLSNTEVRVNTIEQKVQVTSKIFIDDLELALEDFSSKKLKLFVENEATGLDSILNAYINANIQFDLSDSAISLNFIGKEMSDDLAAVWCYMEADYSDLKQEWKVSNTILRDQYEDQRNMTVIKKDDKKLAHWFFDYSYYQDSIKF